MPRLLLTIALLHASLGVAAPPQPDDKSARVAHLKSAIGRSPSNEMRFKALDEYVRIAPASEALGILTAALDDSSPDVRGLAARRLGTIGRKATAAIPALRVKLDDREHRARWISNHFAMQRAVRFDVAEALGLIGPAAHAATPVLRKMAQDDTDPEVRVSAALALLRIFPKDNLPLQDLVRSLENDKNGTGGPICAAEALRQLGSRAISAFESVVIASKHRDEFVRISAVDALAAIGPERAVDVLRDRLKDKDAQVRESASEALGTLGPIAAPAVADLILALSDDSDILSFHVRESAARTLGLIGPQAVKAIPHLERLAANPNDKDLQSIAVKSLRQLREQPANKCVNRSGESGGK